MHPCYLAEDVEYLDDTVSYALAESRPERRDEIDDMIDQLDVVEAVLVAHEEALRAYHAH